MLECACDHGKKRNAACVMECENLSHTALIVSFTLSSTPAGTTMGLNESECGQIGVIIMAGTLGWIIEAPAATAYAVLPVGVDTITPEQAERHKAESYPQKLETHLLQISKYDSEERGQDGPGLTSHTHMTYM